MKIFAGLLAVLAVAMLAKTPADAEKKTRQIPATAKVVRMLAIWENARKMAARSNCPCRCKPHYSEGRHGGGLSARYVHVR